MKSREIGVASCRPARALGISPGVRTMTKGSTYVEYGCGWSVPETDGWRHFDASPTLLFERIPVIGKLYTKNRVRFPDHVEFGDIVRGLPVEAQSLDGVYCSHVPSFVCRLQDCDKKHTPDVETRQAVSSGASGSGVYGEQIRERSFARRRARIHEGYRIGIRNERSKPCAFRHLLAGEFQTSLDVGLRCIGIGAETRRFYRHQTGIFR